MALKYDLDIGSTYNIPLLAPAVLGTSYKSATVLGLLDYTSALAIEDVNAIHASVLALLPTGTPSDASKLVYAKIRTTSNNIRVIALDWISTQPQLVDGSTITIKLTNVTQNQIPALASILTANGYTSFSFE